LFSKLFHNDLNKLLIVRVLSKSASVLGIAITVYLIEITFGRQESALYNSVYWFSNVIVLIVAGALTNIISFYGKSSINLVKIKFIVLSLFLTYIISTRQLFDVLLIVLYASSFITLTKLSQLFKYSDSQKIAAIFEFIIRPWGLLILWLLNILTVQYLIDQNFRNSNQNELFAFSVFIVGLMFFLFVFLIKNTGNLHKHLKPVSNNNTSSSDASWYLVNILMFYLQMQPFLQATEFSKGMILNSYIYYLPLLINQFLSGSLISKISIHNNPEANLNIIRRFEFIQYAVGGLGLLFSTVISYHVDGKFSLEILTWLVLFTGFPLIHFLVHDIRMNKWVLIMLIFVCLYYVIKNDNPIFLSWLSIVISLRIVLRAYQIYDDFYRRIS
jgi:hypothetical protein